MLETSSLSSQRWLSPTPLSVMAGGEGEGAVWNVSGEGDLCASVTTGTSSKLNLSDKKISEKTLHVLPICECYSS